MWGLLCPVGSPQRRAPGWRPSGLLRWWERGGALLGKTMSLCTCHDPAVGTEGTRGREDWAVGKLLMKSSGRRYGWIFENESLAFVFSSFVLSFNLHLEKASLVFSRPL